MRINARKSPKITLESNRTFKLYSFDPLDLTPDNRKLNMKEKKPFTKFLFAMFFAFISFLWAMNLYAQTESQFEVKITDPDHDGAEVAREMDVKGTTIIPSGNYLWVLIHRTKGFRRVWWPQGEAEIDLQTNTWELTVTFGQSRDIGYELKIAAITVNKQEHKRLQDYYDNAMITGDWRPIKMPPTTSAPQIRTVKKVAQ